MGVRGEAVLSAEGQSSRPEEPSQEHSALRATPRRADRDRMLAEHGGDVSRPVEAEH